ncbi:AraC family transcriptional regulator [Paenibacillus methanolicus]|uniref:AraC-like DNA-binding protein n=1 Tax=Paenibacillus methanolicus TaxID=582686 RepID=A0A5S5BR21_9BACL|nr:AraC family transcriptional regulator [Paenibacillus methanolicus]TYP69539.1 AraC-like DNA-binding protein [Paenibacillus methanolicus]
MGYGLSVSLVHPLLSYMARNGYRLDLFREAASFDMKLLQEAEARMREEEFDRLLEEASAFTQDPLLGLHLGQTIELSSLGILGYVLLHCKTIGDALAAYRRYNVILCSGIDIEWETVGQETIIRFNVSDPSRQASRHAVEGMVSSFYHIVLALSCRNIAPIRLHFTHGAPEDGEAYVRLFGIAPVFGRESNLLSVEREMLQVPILFSKGEMFSAFEAYAEEARARLLQGEAFADQVYRWIVRSMPAAFPGVQEAALHFKVSVRTLQANLKREDATYNRLFNKARMEFAVHYLKNPRFTVAEIAYLLQFSEPSAFQSAFKRWTGLPPGRYREMRL